MIGSTETIGLRKDASIRNGSDSMRHGRGPGYKRKLRKDARLARTKQELASAGIDKIFVYWGGGMNIRDLIDHHHITRTKRELDKIVDKRWLELHPKKK